MALSASEVAAANTLFNAKVGCFDIALLFAICARAGIDPQTAANLVQAKYNDVYALIVNVGVEEAADFTRSSHL